ncbi:Aquaporin-4 [Camellia lanceoleosa]|uniref:Aquaporin-4 n=1 Tax=Camellia lanceoleosa TaxID=1840588 RepID=A0ACC0HJ61_9ERIC|nr:Aquaporin-4 [Camellia lanceoleosa]
MERERFGESGGGVVMRSMKEEGGDGIVFGKVWQASLGELLGTTILVFMIDTIVISSYETKTITPNLIISILVGLTITILILAIFPISGGHINPIISFFAAHVDLISFSRATVYIVAQCLGGALGAVALKAVVNSTIEQTFSLGGCTLSVIAPGPNGPIVAGLTMGQELWFKIICTFVFLFATIWIAFDDRQAKALGHVVVFSIIGLVVGLLVFISTTVTTTKGYTGAEMNPLRCFGLAMMRGRQLWNGHWIFWVGPTIACVAFYIYTPRAFRVNTSIPCHANAHKHYLLNILKGLCRAITSNNVTIKWED